MATKKSVETPAVKAVETTKNGKVFNNNMLYAIVGSVTILSLAIISSAYMISDREDDSNKTAQTTQDGKVINSISVQGEGKIEVKPSVATVMVNVNKVKPTTEEAMEGVNEDIASIKYILKGSGIKEDDIKTETLNTYPEMEYLDGKSNVIGQRAYQTISFKVRELEEGSARLSKIVDDIAKIDGVVINAINFNVDEKDSYNEQARAEAYKNAEKKAQQLAELGGLKLKKPISVSEAVYSYDYPIYYNGGVMVDGAEMGKGTSQRTDISTGTMEVTATISIVFGIE